jgi:ATP-dependent DNA helicase RecG
MEREMEYKTLSKRVKQLLSCEEGYEVDWKSRIKGLESEDIVAFANSKDGGAILIGVDEIKGGDGRQKSKIVGCQISDENKMKIKSKAQNCVPPIEIDIITENAADEPFYRIEIPSGNNKPYCTLKGVYKIRDDGNNQTLTPNKLLTIFIETESEIFLKRFKNAAKELEEVLNESYGEINQARSDIEAILPIVEGIQDYNYMVDDMSGKVDNIDNITEDTNITTNWNEERIIALLNHFNIEDPWVTSLKERVKDFIIWDAENGMNIQDKEYFKRIARFHKATDEQLKQWLQEVIDEKT